jgi:hypothetical protein
VLCIDLNLALCGSGEICVPSIAMVEMQDHHHTNGAVL